LAGLAAEGQTTVDDIKYIKRGYEDFEGKLASLGADIKEVDSEAEARKFNIKVV
jgi:UDP-N-acetylglucosamine 1-carboxyvinyltransferase 2